MVAPRGAPNPGHPRVTEGMWGPSSEATAASSKGFKDWGGIWGLSQQDPLLPATWKCWRQDGKDRSPSCPCHSNRYPPLRHQRCAAGRAVVGPVGPGVHGYSGASLPAGAALTIPFPSSPVFGAHHAAGAPPAHGCIECHASSAHPWCLAHHQPRPRKPQQVSKHHPHVNLQSNKTTPKPQPVPAAVPSTSMAAGPPEPPLVPVRGPCGASPHLGHPGRTTGSGENWCGEQAWSRVPAVPTLGANGTRGRATSWGALGCPGRAG